MAGRSTNHRNRQFAMLFDLDSRPKRIEKSLAIRGETYFQFPKINRFKISDWVYFVDVKLTPFLAFLRFAVSENEWTVNTMRFRTVSFITVHQDHNATFGDIATAFKFLPSNPAKIYYNWIEKMIFFLSSIGGLYHRCRIDRNASGRLGNPESIRPIDIG